MNLIFLPNLSYKNISIHFKEIISKGAQAYTIKIFGAALAFIFNLIITRNLGADQSGIFFLALTIVTIISIIGRMGIDSAYIKLISGHAVNEQWKYVKGIYQKGTELSIMTTSILTLLIIMFSKFLSCEILSKPQLTNTLTLMSASIVPLSFLLLNSQALRGLKFIKESQITQIIVTKLFFIFMLSVLNFFTVLNITLVVYAFILSTTFAAIISYHQWKSKITIFRNIKGSYKLRELVSCCFSMYLIDIYNLVFMWSPSFILGYYCKSSSVAVYHVAFRTSILINFVFIAINSIALPKYSELFNQNKLPDLYRIVRNVVVLLLVISSPLFICFILYSENIMRLYGPEFANGSNLLIILLISQYINIITGTAFNILLMTAYQNIARNITLIFIILNIVSQISLIKVFDIAGAAYSNIIIVLCMNFCSIYFLNKKLGIKAIFKLNT